jgi:osmotically-inducible protein OsmY
VPNTLIRSTVSHGWVTLDGEVGVCHERDAAERAICNLPAVRGVVNRIEVNLPYVKGESPVQSWAEREAVLGAARYTPGVKIVDDHLHFEQFA